MKEPALVQTGHLTEKRVRERLENLGLIVSKPWPDRGVDIEVWHPENPGTVARIQVKGRNPRKLNTLRWFQLRVTRKQLEDVRERGLPAEAAWVEKVKKADFFILDAVRVEEMWVLPQRQVIELIQLNEMVYGERPDNVFTFDEPLRGKQKEMNLDIPDATRRFYPYRNNFSSLTDYLSI